MTLKSRLLPLFALTCVSSSFAIVHVHQRNKPYQTPLHEAEAQPIFTNETKTGVVHTALSATADDCKCTFSGVCTCDLQLKFMSCIRNACASGKCTCEGNHFLTACQAMDATCPKGGLQCSEDKASCLSGAVVTRPGAALNSTQAATTLEVPSSAPQKIGADGIHAVKRLRLRRTGCAVYAVLGILCAFLYYKYYHLKLKEMGEKRTTSWFKLKRIESLQPGVFNSSLFDCMLAPRLCIMSFCCPAIIWADTVDMTQKLTYWLAFASFFFLLVVGPYTAGISLLAIAIMGTITRQSMRKQYKMVSNTLLTVSADLFAWLCCAPCAIVQEHSEAVFQATQLS